MGEIVFLRKSDLKCALSCFSVFAFCDKLGFYYKCCMLMLVYILHLLYRVGNCYINPLSAHLLLNLYFTTATAELRRDNNVDTVSVTVSTLVHVKSQTAFMIIIKPLYS